ncbi:MAG: DUF1404 family protein [Corticimicrobacter sp.]|uniref:DUF1404 family protein n=1 Tax=Corticimicrobacter sp. TaxID=2678536 RepID=UPI0032DA0063
MTMRRCWSHPLIPGLLLLLTALARPWLEASMARHMALELPALFIVGWLSARHLRPAAGTPFHAWNQEGIPALLLASLITLFWMIPLALDAAVLDPGVTALKVCSIIVAGLLAGWCWPRLHLIVQALFLFNWTAMNLLIGILYIGAPQQLCSTYLADDQLWAGRGLIAWSLLAMGGWIAWWVLQLSRRLR